MKVYRANKCLTTMTDIQLKAIVAKCIELGVNKDDIALYACDHARGRKEVARAAVAIDLLDSVLTIRHVTPPSPETIAWGGFLETGHIYHERPSLEAILFGE
jgi:hypothetical protein